MQRKSWVFPGFLVLVILLLLSFPALALADDNSPQPMVAGGEISASQPDSQGQVSGGDTAAKQDVSSPPADSNPAPVNATPAPDSQTAGNQSGGQASDNQPADQSAPADQSKVGGENPTTPDSAVPTDQGQVSSPAQDSPAPAAQDKAGDDKATVPATPAPADQDKAGDDKATVPATPAPADQDKSGDDKATVPATPAPADQGKAGDGQVTVPATPAPADQDKAGEGQVTVPAAPAPADQGKVGNKPVPDYGKPVPVNPGGVQVKPVPNPGPVQAEQAGANGKGVTPQYQPVSEAQPAAGQVISQPVSVVSSAPAAGSSNLGPVAVVTPVTVPIAPVYIVQPGDTLEKISQKTGVPVERIAQANGLQADSKTVAVPLEQASSMTVSKEQGQDSKENQPSVTYKVRKGESLWLIGRSLGVLWENIMKANNLKDYLIYPNQELMIPGLDSLKGVIGYKIKDGDTLYLIGQALGLNYEDIMSLNGIKDIWIYPDHKLELPDRNKSSLYKVQEGDTLDSVAQKFDVSANDITGFQVTGDRLYVGQVLVIPSTVGVSRSMQLTRAIVPADDDLGLLARAIYAEARGEIYEGQVAVGAVIMNRLKTPGFPKTIKDIIFEPGAFTAVDDGQINLIPDAQAYKAAKAAMDGSDPSLGAIYYWNPKHSTSKWIWSRPVIKTIGEHVFAR